MKTVYRTLRVLVVTALCLALVVPALTYVALSVTPVQQRIAREAESQLSNLLDSKVTIGSLGIVPFNRVMLRDVVITNHQGSDTILTANRLGAGIRLMSLLSDDPITITHMELMGMWAHIHRDSIGAPLNIQPIINALQPKQKSQAPKPFNLKINTVMIRSSRLSYDVFSEPTSAQFNPNHIAISNLRADINIPRLKNNDFIVKIKRMGFNEQSGFNLASFTANATINDSELSLSQFSFTLPRTSIKANDITLPLTGLKNIQRALKTENITLEIAPGSYATPADFSAFVPKLETLTDRLIFNALRLEGNQNSADVDINLAYGNSTKLLLEGSLHGLNNSGKTHGDLNSLHLATSGENISQIASSITTLPLSTIALLNRLGTININSKGKFIDNAGSLTLDAVTQQGEFELQATGTYHNPSDFSIKGELATTEPFNLGNLLANNNLSVIDGSVQLDYIQSNCSRSGSADILLDKLTFKGIDYTQLEATIGLNNDLASLKVNIDNEAVAFHASGEYSLAKNHKIVNLEGELERFLPNMMHLTPKHPGTNLSGQLDIAMEGARLDNMLGTINLQNLKIQRANNETFTLKSLNLQADSALITLHSDYIDGTLRGEYDFRNIARSGRKILAQAYPTLVGNDSADTIASNDFTFHFTVKETEQPAAFFKLPLSVIYPVDISGEINDHSNLAALAIDAPYLRQGNKLIENTRLSAAVGGIDKNLNLDFTTTAPTKNGPMYIALSANGIADHLNTDLAWKINRDKAYQGHIATLTNFWRDNEIKSLTTEINLLPGNLTFNDSTWTINPAKIQIAGAKNIHIEGVNVHRNNQFVRINGDISLDDTALLTLDLRNFNLDYLFESLGIEKVQLGGDATGTFYASHIFSPEPVLETPGLEVTNISYNKVVLGNALVMSHWQPESKGITLDAIVDQPNSRKAYINGTIYPLSESLDIRFNVDHTNVAFMQPYMEAFASDISGHASGKCRLFGTFKYIDLEGDVFADDLRMKINFTNTYYTATDSVHFRPGLIDLNGITIHDAEGHTADLNGWVRHKFFKEPWFEFSLSGAENFLAYNETPKNNPRWYGKIYGNGGATVKGFPGQVDINVDMATAANSTFTFVLSDQEVAEEFSFLTFRDKKALSAQLTDTIQLEQNNSMALVERLRAMVDAHNPDIPSDYNISLQMRVTPQAQLILVMDPVGGDRIRAWGSGHLRMDYGSANNDLRMYGTYTLDRGYYNFTLQDVIIKDFTIKPGSEIVFNGDPYAAQLNIQATYTLNANLSDLDESFLQDQDLNRTNVPVSALMKVMGDIRQPEIAFDLEFPTLTSDVYRKVRSIISTDDMMNRQIIYLLALNRFYTPEYMSSTTKGNELVSVASSTISSQLSNLLGQISDNWNIAPTFRSDRGDFSDVEVDVALSSRLLNNRLLFNGNFGYRDNDLNTNQFIGDFDLEYLLDREGRWRLKAYNRYNDQNYYLRTAKTTQGVGVVLKRDFDSFFPFFRKKKQQPAKKEED